MLRINAIAHLVDPFLTLRASRYQHALGCGPRSEFPIRAGATHRDVGLRGVGAVTRSPLPTYTSFPEQGEKGRKGRIREPSLFVHPTLSRTARRV
ncbi:hypothetical protein BTZ20_5482 [Rhodococcus sp. MTM3W5.2]|nr:hypothetical protein BTZ20_5482 [Rhodococcus sp. MTM3W5.2]